MAERPIREGLSRRSSLRKTRAEGDLPPEFLDTLEQKRKQLDESIHKYIASKEREYKLFEKDVRAQRRIDHGHNRQDAATEANNDGSQDITSSEVGGETIIKAPAVKSQRHGKNPVDVLLSNGTKRDVESLPIRGSDSHIPAEQRAKGSGQADNETDFVGVFTPHYLPIIDSRSPGISRLERAESAPPNIESPKRNSDKLCNGPLLRAESDTAVVSSPKLKRPVHLHLAQRTSSSGSSADGRLASAMKSPTQSLQRPRKKRVSLFIEEDGSIVAPNEDVPLSISHSKTPSHSRTRSAPKKESPGLAGQSVPPMVSEETTVNATIPGDPDSITNAGAISNIHRRDMHPGTEPQRSPLPASNLSPRLDGRVSSTPPKSGIDPDGDLFDLEEEEAGLPSPHESDDTENALESEDDLIIGRVDRDDVHSGVASASVAENPYYDPEAGVLPEPAPAEVVPVDADDTAMHLEFGPKASAASQQPTKPGFRRPSVIADPVFNGNNYQNVEAKAVENEIYGSSFIRPPSKGSFTGGSLGESYMAKHAEKMMEMRIKREHEITS